MNEEKCSACGSGPVSHFVCCPGAEPSDIKLCQDCWDKQAGWGENELLRGFMASLAAGKCRFCGAKAAAVDQVAGAAYGMDAEPEFLCFSCFTESNKVALPLFQAFEAESASLSFAEQSNRLRGVLAEVDAHMSRWLSQRLN